MSAQTDLSSRELGRRTFLSSSLVGAGPAAGSATRAVAEPAHARGNRGGRLPREVWIACVSHEGLQAATPAAMRAKMLQRMEEIIPMQPDVICLPETFLKPNLA